MTQDFKAKVFKESQKYKQYEGQSSFVDGVLFTLDAIWHETKELRRVDESTPLIILYHKDVLPEVVKNKNQINNKDLMLKWAYLEDIMPIN